MSLGHTVGLEALIIHCLSGSLVTNGNTVYLFIVLVSFSFSNENLITTIQFKYQNSVATATTIDGATNKMTHIWGIPESTKAYGQMQSIKKKAFVSFRKNYERSLSNCEIKMKYCVIFAE